MKNSFAITRPRLYIIIIKDERGQLEELSQLVISLLLWTWDNRHVFLLAGEIVCQVYDIVMAVRGSWISMFAMLLQPVKFQMGVG